MAKDVHSLRPLAPGVIRCPEFHRDQLLSMEWLRANRLGAYSSSTIIGCNTRRYHGLLVAATNPPVGRVVALSTVMEQLVVHGKAHNLATNEFPDTFSPAGYTCITEFHDGPAAAFVYVIGRITLIKRVLLCDNANAVAITYELEDPTGSVDKLLLQPFTALRDFHALRSASGPHEMSSEPCERGVEIADGLHPKTFPSLFLHSTQADFQADPQWWYRLLYRVDRSRGQDATEDLYSPGQFVWTPGEKSSCTLTASLGEIRDVPVRTTRSETRRCQIELLTPFAKASKPIRRLAASTEAFLVNRGTVRSGSPGLSILAGFPWFADWGRDTFIALPGLLLCTQRYDLARRVFRTYAEGLEAGMVPNRFDDYANSTHFNSVDASLWFVVAAERYLRATNDEAFGNDVLLPACRTIVTHYAEGTRFHIHTDADGLLWAGSRDTQLTWMDAKIGDEVITGRWGKAVEVNSLWYCAHCILAERLQTSEPDEAQRYALEADRIGFAFVNTFWNAHFEWLCDVVNEEGADASLRPNQIFAVSLPYSPLSVQQQRGVVQAVRENLLTPMGLRTLSPRDRRYCRRYGGGGESRERAYHQGTVWAWLIGPFIEAHLKVEHGEASPKAVAQAKGWLTAFDTHLDQACIGQISEIFDGDPPHEPHGCFAQAWSVAEVLRAKLLVAECEAKCATPE